jgi:mono/diheme cytochrome c family protein
MDIQMRSWIMRSWIVRSWIMFSWIMRSGIRAAFLALPVCGACLAMALAGCKPLPPSKPASEWTPQEARGAAVFKQTCARCHNPTTTRPLNGPGLQALTKLKAMPSGEPPTDERLMEVILHGRQMMPPAPLSDQQLLDLLAYLHTL